MSSRIDSTFLLPITIWDKDAVLAVNAGIGGEGEALVEVVGFGDDRQVHITKTFQLSFPNGGADGENLHKGIRSSLLKMLRKLGMVDTAEALLAENRRWQQPDKVTNVNPLINVEVGAVDVIAARVDVNVGAVMMITDRGVVNGLDRGGGIGGNNNKIAVAAITDIIRATAVGVIG